LLRGITAVLDAALIGRAPGIAGSVGGIRYQQRDHHKTDRTKTDRLHDCPPLSFNTDAYYRLANVIDPATNNNPVNDLARY
jgi:hypothetical protein